jgi:UDP-glucose 4-epimerase
VTGGAGYIGSHTCVELLEAGHEVFVVDNLSNGHEAALDRVRGITNSELQFMNMDICDTSALNKVFKSFKPETVIHFAGLKAVGESLKDPLKYYDVNIGAVKSMTVFELVKEFEDISGVTIKVKYLPRREGGLAAFWADSSKAFEVMGWKIERNIKNICEDTWRWHKLNPTGYGRE